MPRRLTIGKRKPHRECGRLEPLVAGRQRDRRPLDTQEIQPGQVQRIQRAHRMRKRLQRTHQHGAREFDQVHAVNELAHVGAMRGASAARMHAVEIFEFEHPAGDECLRPEGGGRRAATGEEARQQYRGFKMDQRSVRLESNSRSTSASLVKGRRRGRLVLVSTEAGVSRPWRNQPTQSLL